MHTVLITKFAAARVSIEDDGNVLFGGVVAKIAKSIGEITFPCCRVVAEQVLEQSPEELMHLGAPTANLLQPFRGHISQQDLVRIWRGIKVEGKFPELD